MNEEYLNKYALKKSNRFNVYCLLVMSILAIVACIFNELGLFSLDKTVVRVSMLLIIINASLPGILYFVHDKLLKKETPIFEYSFFKRIVISAAFIVACVLCISLSFHAVLVLMVPTLMAAQYKNSKALNITIFIFSLVLIIISVYGSFLFGIYDANLLKPLTKEEALELSNRLKILKSSRMTTVFLHYVVPRMFFVSAIDFIGFAITRRNKEMVEMQINLSQKIQEEILNKSKMQNGVIEHLADIIESRDIETGEHIKRTKKYVSILVNKMLNNDKFKNELSYKMADDIINAAPLHDIGKIAVSDLILCKPRKLTDEEFEKMKIHTTKGGEIINKILIDLGDEEFLGVAYDVATSHHEKWNGCGYPNGLKENDIPISGRIMAIADVFDALISKRVYKNPMPFDEAIEIIIKDSGTHFDPDIVDVFKSVIDEFRIASTEKL